MINGRLTNWELTQLSMEIDRIGTENDWLDPQRESDRIEANIARLDEIQEGAYPIEIEPREMEDQYGRSFNQARTVNLLRLYGQELYITQPAPEESPVLKMVCKLAPRETLIKFEGLEHNFHWTGPSPKVGFIREFSGAKVCLEYVETFVAENLDLKTPKAEPPKETPPKSAPAPSSNEDQADVEIKINNPALRLKVSKGRQ